MNEQGELAGSCSKGSCGARQQTEMAAQRLLNGLTGFTTALDDGRQG